MKLIKYRRKLLALIRQSGWKIEEVAGLIKMPESALYKIIRGEQGYGAETIYSFTEVLGCTLEELLEGDDDED